MTLLFTDLTYAQIRLLIRLDRSHYVFGNRSDETDPGLEAGEIRESEIRPMRQMMQLGLVQADAGWRGSGWIRLTDAGRRIRDEGLVE